MFLFEFYDFFKKQNIAITIPSNSSKKIISQLSSLSSDKPVLSLAFNIWNMHLVFVSSVK